MAEGIRIEGIGKRFGPVPVLRDVSATLAAGEFLSLLGPSGCGKTTLLRILAGLEVADAGRVVIGGRDVTRLRPAERDVAMVFQNAGRAGGDRADGLAAADRRRDGAVADGHTRRRCRSTDPRAWPRCACSTAW